MFFKNKNRKNGEDLNRKVEKFKKWWQDQPQDVSSDRSNRSQGERFKKKPFDSSFVYYEEA